MTKNFLKAQNIRQNIWKVSGSSNVYLVIDSDPIVIDTGDHQDRNFVATAISDIVPLNEVTTVILTHMHYDHVSNIDLFPNARIFASAAAIEDFKSNPNLSVLSQGIVPLLKNIRLIPLKDMQGLKIIETPGHTRGSVCLYHADQDVLFTGDTFFYPGVYGRCDLPTSQREKMPNSLKKLEKYKDSLICPGHDY